jgi:competence protein ComEC
MIPIWKNIPFLRLLLPLAAGILCGWYFSLHFKVAVILAGLTIPFLLFYFIASERRKFFSSATTGISINLLLMALGLSLVWFNQIPKQPTWVGNLYCKGDFLQLRLLEPVSEREKNYKALATVTNIYRNNNTIKVSGKAVIYFRKDSVPPALKYGDIIIVNKQLQEITNSGNPGGFDYKRYALFNGTTHQLFLQASDYKKSMHAEPTYFWKRMYQLRSYVLQTIRTYVKNERESSVAEALLIGYRDDLDRDLVQAYSNTGVVHVIAISGMHLGLIYVLLLFLLKPLDRFKKLKIVKTILIIIFLWVFSLLTGGGASVMRAVIMFSFIAGGDLLNRKGNSYNSMAASAFVLLCFNPFLLWDVGFQLSYAAVLSIVLFMKPIYHWFSIQNKLLDQLWKLNAVTIAAQILTLPLCLYHFHQMPTLFILSNFIAVPLSTFVLYGLILLMAFSFFTAAATVIGSCTAMLLKWMNQFILWIDHFSFSVVDGISLHPIQTIALYLFIATTSIWLLQKRLAACLWSIITLCLFFGSRAISRYKTSQQQKLVVYNLSQHSAIDVMLGNKYYFIGDSVLLKEGFLRNFHLKPSRVFNQVFHSGMPVDLKGHTAYQINEKKIVLINQSYRYNSLAIPIEADLVIVSGNPRLYVNDLLKTIRCRLVVFDSSNPAWKLALWKKDCDRLNIHYFCTSEQGAFVMSW